MLLTQLRHGNGPTPGGKRQGGAPVRETIATNHQVLCSKTLLSRGMGQCHAARGSVVGRWVACMGCC